MSQFQRASQGAKEITSLTDVSIYGGLKNLGGTFRIVWTEEEVFTKGKAGKAVFSVILGMADGIADLSCWDPAVHGDWTRFQGAIVSIQGMSCTKRNPTVTGFALGEWILNINKDSYKINVFNGVENTSIPVNGRVPPSWLRPVSASVPPSPSSRSASIATVGGGGACCSAPHDPTCKATGNLHRAICVTCRMVINPVEPYCSKQVNRAMCSAQATVVTQSPFREVLDKKREKETDVEDEIQEPPAKVLDFKES